MWSWFPAVRGCVGVIGCGCNRGSPPHLGQEPAPLVHGSVQFDVVDDDIYRVLEGGLDMMLEGV